MIYIFGTITNQIIIIILFFSILRYINNYKEFLYAKLTTEKTKLLAEDVYKYLDKYFIKNKVFTITSAILYIIGYIVFFIIIRILNLIHYNYRISPFEQEKLSITFSSFIYILISFGLFIIILILYRRLLDMMFFDEILKLHFYLHNKHFYAKFRRIITSGYLNDIWGKFYLFFFNVSKNRIITSAAIDDVEEINIHSDIYKNQRIINISIFCIDLSQKSIIFQFTFKGLKSFFGFLYFHMRLKMFISKIPFIIIFMGILYDFSRLSIHYTYYSIFIAYLILIFFQCIQFFDSKNNLMDYFISEYFYKNTIPYEEQRKNLNENIQKYLEDLFKSKQNRKLSSYIKDSSLINYLLKDMQEDIYNDEEKKNIKKFNKMYSRWTILLVFSIITSYIVYNKNTYILIILKYNLEFSIMYPVLLLLLLLIYLSYKTFNVPLKTKEYHNTYIIDYFHNKRYSKLFWIFTLFQLYLYWILFLKANLMGINQELLLKIVNMRIIKIFSLDEKIAFFYLHLESILTMTNLHEYPQIVERIRLFINEINVTDIITEDTTLNDLKVYVEDIIENSLRYYQINVLLYTNPFMNFIINIINLIVFWKFFIAYMDAFYIAMNSPNYRILKLIHFFCIAFVKFRYNNK